MARSPTLTGVHAARLERIGAAHVDPLFVRGVGTSIGRRDRARFVVPEAGVPVAAVAERLVARGAAAAQRDVLSARARTQCRPPKLHAAANEIGPSRDIWISGSVEYSVSRSAPRW